MAKESLMTFLVLNFYEGRKDMEVGGKVARMKGKDPRILFVMAAKPW